MQDNELELITTGASQEIEPVSKAITLVESSSISDLETADNLLKALRHEPNSSPSGDYRLSGVESTFIDELGVI